MINSSSLKLFAASFAAVFAIFSITAVQAQEKPRSAPEMNVAGLKLGDRESGKAFLDLYQPRTDEDGLPKYYFYNGQGTTVMKVTAASVEDPYFVTEIEVFGVGESYQKRHYFLKKMPHFVTESGIFIGFRQSGKGLALALIVGVPNVGRSNIIGPKDVIKRKGEPDDQTANEKERIFNYGGQTVEIGGNSYEYSAFYRFYERELRRFILKIEPEGKLETAKARQ